MGSIYGPSWFSIFRDVNLPAAFVLMQILQQVSLNSRHDDEAWELAFGKILVILALDSGTPT